MTLFDFVLSSDLTGVSFSLLSGIVIELLLIPHILLISKRKRLYDIPDSRKSHLECIPRLAGVSFLPAFLLSFLPVVSLYGGSVRELSFLICGASLIFIMGMKDDLIGMRWSYKFVVQLIAALCMIASGTFVNNLYGLFGIYELSPLIGYPLTVFLVVYILNTVNLIDGVDGLASGIVSVAALVLGICLYREHSCHYAALAFAVLGTQIAFLRYNLCSTRKLKIFMGDTGSNLLGYVIAFLAIHYAMSGSGDRSRANSCRPPQGRASHHRRGRHHPRRRRRGEDAGGRKPRAALHGLHLHGPRAHHAVRPCNRRLAEPLMSDPVRA